MELADLSERKRKKGEEERKRRCECFSLAAAGFAPPPPSHFPSRSLFSLSSHALGDVERFSRASGCGDPCCTNSGTAPP